MDLRADIIETIERWADRHGVDDLPAPDNLAHCIVNLPAMRELRDMRNVIVSATRDVTVGHLLDLFGWQSNSISTNPPD